jgi:phosphoglycolate phosphatase-like HAD superfamily hydrolase
VHYHAFSKACVEVLGHSLSLEAISVQGSTDPRILRDAFAAAGVADDLWRPHQEQLLEGIAAVVARDAQQMQIRVMPGVQDALRYLADQGKLLGVATGNLEAIGWLKLDYAGLREWFRFGGFSDQHEERADMIAAAAEQARALTHSDGKLIIIGDTASDIAAARANGIPVIAVATGHTSYEQLLTYEPDVCCETLSALLAAEEAA